MTDVANAAEAHFADLVVRALHDREAEASLYEMHASERVVMVVDFTSMRRGQDG